MSTPFVAGRPESVPRYATLFEGFSPEELELIPQIKRLFECYEGDRELRAALEAGTVSEAQVALLREIGITFDLEQLAALWEKHPIVPEALAGPGDPDEVQLAQEALQGTPILELWSRFLLKKAEMYRLQREFCTTEPSLSATHSAWRQRRLAATRSELGSYGHNIDHPSLAIELAVGCSVGCYFCAFDAQKLTKIFDYTVPENVELFRAVATTLRDVLGWSAGHTLLYWSTEPADNPHYIDFLREYHCVTGAVLCTATARADETWVANLLEFYRSHTQPWPRISVLTRSIMYKLHKRFTPAETRDMAMLMQQKDTEDLRTKVPGGRDKMLDRLETYGDLRKIESGTRPDDLFVPQGSIACVSGFLINLVDRTVKLISPCYTTTQYRYGYRIFDEGTFTDAEDFDRLIRGMIERKMVDAPYPQMPMRFRDDLRYRPTADGFHVVSPNQVHHCVKNDIYGPLGNMLHRGTMTYAEVCDELVDVHRFDPMLVAAVICSLFDDGLLDELAVEAPGASAGTSPALSLAATA